MPSGLAFILSSKVYGNVVIRLSICSHRTTLKDVEQVFDKLKEIGEKIYEEEEMKA